MTGVQIAVAIGGFITLFLTVSSLLWKSSRGISRIESAVENLVGKVDRIEANQSKQADDISALKVDTAVHKVEIAALKAIAAHTTQGPIINNNGGGQS